MQIHDQLLLLCDFPDHQFLALRDPGVAFGSSTLVRDVIRSTKSLKIRREDGRERSVLSVRKF